MTRDVTVPVTKMRYRKHRGIDKDYKKADGKASKPPSQISLRITNVCNHRCAVCGQYGIRGYMYEEQAKHLYKTLPLDKYKQVVDEMAQHKPIYYVTGGEAFLYPDLVPLMNYVKKKGSLVSVVTNGVRLKECAEEIVRNGWDMLLVSFDGPEEIHDKCRGIRGAYKTALEGLLEIKKKKRELKRKKPYLLTSLTLSGANVGHLEETFELNKQIDPFLMVVYLSWFTAKEIGNGQARILKDALGIDAYTWNSYVRHFTQQEAESFRDALERVRKKKWPFDFIVIPDLEGDDARDYYLHPEKMFGYNKCAAPFMMIDIMPNGDVVTCRDYVDVKVGNLNEDSLLNIWNNDKFVKFHKLLIDRGGLLSQCSRCCGLMGF